MPTIRIPGALHSLTGGVAELAVTAATVREALAELDRHHPGVAGRLFDGAGAIKPFIRIYVGPDDIGALAGLDTRVEPADEIAIIPAVAGGAESGMRDDQLQRYARHIILPDIGRQGQTALMVATAHLPLREAEPTSELIAATYLAAGGVGSLVVPNASDAQRADLAAHGPDTRVHADGTGRDVCLAPRPTWWPAAEGDAVALAFWRGALAATRWMADVTRR